MSRIRKALVFNVLSLAVAAAGLFVLSSSLYELCFWALVITVLSSLVFIFAAFGKEDITDMPFVALVGRFVSVVVSFGAILTGLLQMAFGAGFFALAEETLELVFPMACFALTLGSFTLFEADRRLNRKKTRWYPIGAVAIYFVICWALLFDGEPATGLVLFETGKGLISSICLSAGAVVLCALASGFFLYNSQRHAPRIRRNREQA